MKKLAGILMGLSMLAGPAFAFAETATSTNAQVQAALAQIQALKAQMDALKALQAQIASTTANITNSFNLLRNLKQGMSGEDVKALQAILASDPSVYPEGLVTGFFGNKTAEALKRFQKKNGLEAVGFVGPRTLKKLNEHSGQLGLSQEDDDKSNPGRREGEKNKRLCIKVPPGQGVAPGWVRRDDDGDDDDDRGERENQKGKMILVPCKEGPTPWGNGSTTPQLPPPPPPTGSTTPVSTLPTFTMAQVATHNTQNNCYTVINNSVYNLTSWISQHPGGASAIIGLCGINGTNAFMAQHGGQGNPAQELALFKIGTLVQ